MSEQPFAPQRRDDESAGSPGGGDGAAAAGGERRSAVESGIDDVLADIDGVLEENAEEFVRGFVQKGGQ